MVAAAPGSPRTGDEHGVSSHVLCCVGAHGSVSVRLRELHLGPPARHLRAEGPRAQRRDKLSRRGLPDTPPSAAAAPQPFKKTAFKIKTPPPRRAALPRAAETSGGPNMSVQGGKKNWVMLRMRREGEKEGGRGQRELLWCRSLPGPSTSRAQPMSGVEPAAFRVAPRAIKEPARAEREAEHVGSEEQRSCFGAHRLR